MYLAHLPLLAVIRFGLLTRSWASSFASEYTHLMVSVLDRMTGCTPGGEHVGE